MVKIKTLKSKIIFINISLVFIILLIGLISSINVYKLGKSIDGLMTNNYNSIAVATTMRSSIESEDKAILQFIQFQKKGAVDLFYNSDNEFYKAFNTAENNITEVGEKEIISRINNDYLIFVKSFADLQDFQATHNPSETLEYYKNYITPQVEKIKKELEDIKLLNEKSMFNSKSKVKDNTVITVYVIFILSVISAIVGLIISVVYSNKSLRPIYLLTETIKSVKEGELYKQAPVIYEDEVGMLAQEFNSMTKRLYEFEQSTLGNILAEKNKSVAIVKSISDPLIVLDESYKVLLLNSSCEELFEIQEKNTINKHFLEVLRNTELYDHIFSVINNKCVSNEKYIDIEIKGEVYYFNMIVNVVRGNNNNINGVIVLLKNITEFKILEKMRTNFIATVSHELKTPLTTIMMGTGLMVDKSVGSLNEKQKNIMQTMQEEIEKLTELVSNLLKLSRIESDKAIFDIKPCSIIEIVDYTIKNYAPQALRNNVNLYHTLNEESPKVKADSEKINWVLNNLVTNALKHTDSGDEIEIGAYINGEYLNIFVRDTGEGIPKEYQEEIFERFVKHGIFRNDLSSTGLGLSIAKEIVKAHGGSIWCESKIDQGSKFTFTLPIEQSMDNWEGQ